MRWRSRQAWNSAVEPGGRDVGLERRELVLRGAHAAVEARDLRVHRLRRDLVVRDLEPGGGHEVREADRDAARHGIPVKNEIHSPSPNLSAISWVSVAS